MPVDYFEHQEHDAKRFDGLPCIFCAGKGISTKRGDHIPSKSMYPAARNSTLRGMPAKRIDSPACKACNDITKDYEPFITWLALALKSKISHEEKAIWDWVEKHQANNDFVLTERVRMGLSSDGFLRNRISNEFHRNTFNEMDARITLYGAKVGMAIYNKLFDEPIPKNGAVMAWWNCRRMFKIDPGLLQENIFGGIYTYFMQGNDHRKTTLGTAHFRLHRLNSNVGRRAFEFDISFFNELYYKINVVEDMALLRSAPNFSEIMENNPPYRPGFKRWRR